MPRRSPLPQREAEICTRLREARKLRGLSRVAFAAQLEIDSSKLASYEHSRTPVPFGTAYLCGCRANINLRWLATGKLPLEPQIHISEFVVESIPVHIAFSAIYDAVLEDEFERWLKNLAKKQRSKIENLKELDFFARPPAFSTPMRIMGSELVDIFRGAELLSYTMSPDSLQQFIVKLRKPVEEYERASKNKMNEIFEARLRIEEEATNAIMGNIKQKLNMLRNSGKTK